MVARPARPHGGAAVSAQVPTPPVLPARRQLAWLAFSLRRRWYLVAVGLLVGAVAGVTVGLMSPYRAEVLVRVTAASPDGEAVAEAVQTVLVLVDTDDVFNDAAARSGQDPADLRDRTRTQVTGTGSDLITIAVTADSPEQAQADAVTISDSALRLVATIADQSLAVLEGAGDRAINSGRLRDQAAEDARRVGIGQAVAARQGDALATAVLVDQVGQVQGATRALGSPAVIGAVGAVAGTLAGAFVAAAVGTRRARIRTLRDLHDGVPSVEAYGRDGITRVAARCLPMTTPLAAVLALPGAAPELGPMSERLERELRIEGMHPLVVGLDVTTGTTNGDRPADPPVGSELALGPARVRALAATAADLLVVTGDADDETLARVAGRADVVVLVGSRGTTRFSDLADVRARLDGSPVVVVLP